MLYIYDARFAINKEFGGDCSYVKGKVCGADYFSSFFGQQRNGT
jgi:hypothetical protein